MQGFKRSGIASLSSVTRNLHLLEYSFKQKNSYLKIRVWQGRRDSATCGFGGKRYSTVCQTKKLASKDTSLAGETRFCNLWFWWETLLYRLPNKKTRIQRYEFGKGDAILQPVVLVGNATLPFAKQKNSYPKIRVWQGRRDSNTQPTVLETATLPLSHSPKQRSYYITKKEICQLFLGHF